MTGKRVFLVTFLSALLSTFSLNTYADYYVVTSWSDTPCCAPRYTYSSCSRCASDCDNYCEDDGYYSRRTTVRYPVAFVGTREYAWVPFP